MKKSKIAIALGAFIGITLILAGNQCNTKLYEKQKTFTSSSEILEQLNNKELRDYNKRKTREVGNCGETKDLLESVSERMRLTNSYFNYDKIEIEEVVDLTENQKKEIIDAYEKLKLSYTKAKPVSKVEAVRVKLKTYYTDYSDDGEKIFRPNDWISYNDLVFIDEGEGMVIDYISESKERDSIEG
ncbi:MAG: hypothetical protein IJH34_11440 [Romboutsia sp.]|nr:hypothetical protein [Romboutsia sp.]